jgi:hypothetical protein
MAVFPPAASAAYMPFIILPGALPSPSGNVGLRFWGVFIASVGDLEGEGKESPFPFCVAMMTEVLRAIRSS